MKKIQGTQFFMILFLCGVGFILAGCRLTHGTIRHDIVPRQSIFKSGKQVSPTAIEELSTVNLNGTKQWILIRGHNRNNPVILSLHGGPGFPNMWNIEDASRLIEQDFTVVYWEQTGTMKSYNHQLTCKDLDFDSLVEDVISLSEYLIRRFDHPQIYLRGESFGTVIGLMAASKRPDLYKAYIANSQIIEFQENECLSLQYADSCARAAGNKKAIKELTQLDPTSPSYGSKQNITLKIWVGAYGGWFYGMDNRDRASAAKSLQKMLQTPEYSYHDMWHTIMHPLFTAQCVEADARNINFFRDVPKIDVPIYFMNGRYDYMVPIPITLRYFNYLNATKGKYMVWFDKSAHTPMLEEPDAYYRATLKIKNSLLQASTNSAE